MFILQIISYIALTISLWKTTFELVLGNLFEIDIIEYIGLMACFMLMFFNLYSELKNEKLVLISDKRKLKETYKEELLIWDILAIIGYIIKITPLDHLFVEAYYICRILLLVLMVQTSDTLRKIEGKITVRRESESALKIVKLILTVLKFLHVLSLVLIAFSFMEKGLGVEKTWVESNGFGGARNYELYIYAWYWGCTIMSTVGFGDINPTSGSKHVH